VTPNFFQVFAKNSLIKNIFEEGKKFDSGKQFLGENSSKLGVFWPRRGLQAEHETVRNIPATKQSNETEYCMQNF